MAERVDVVIAGRALGDRSPAFRLAELYHAAGPTQVIVVSSVAGASSTPVQAVDGIEHCRRSTT